MTFPRFQVIPLEPFGLSYKGGKKLISFLLKEFLSVRVFLPDRVIHLFCDPGCVYITRTSSDVTLRHLLN